MKIIFLTFVLYPFLSLSQDSGMLMNKRPLAPRSNECQLCHIRRIAKTVFIPKVNSIAKEHFEINLVHGNLKRSCNECHDINNSNKLIAPASFQDTSILCSRCHIERYNEWKNGIHGKKVNSWKEAVAFHCIDCHNPHDVAFKKMQARPAPITSNH